MERLSVCLRVLAERSELMSSVFSQGSRQVFADMLSLREEQDKSNKKVRNFQLISFTSIQCRHSTIDSG